MGRVSRTKTALLLAACVSSAAFAQTLQVVPARALVDESVAIRAAGLQPNERVTIATELEDGAGAHWEARAEFMADSGGNVDASTQAAVGGAYKGVSAMGLIWSMTPREKRIAMYRPPADLAPQAIDFRLLRKGEPVATARFEQATLGEGVQRIPVHEGGLRGVLFLPAAQGPSPAVLVVGGSNGGVPLKPAAWLASHGFVALALAYFRYQDLPPMLEAIPLEYFGRALGWLAARPEVAANRRLAVMGSSRGGELALQLGSMYPRIGAVVAYVPADVRYPACCGDTEAPYAWTWQGRPLAWMPVRSMDPMLARRAAIEVERIRGPVLVVSGGDDQIWQSTRMAGDVVARLKGAHFAYRYEHLHYPHAGHLAGRPEIVPAWHGSVRRPVSGREIELGGSAKGDAEASLDAIPKVLEFLRQTAD